MATCMYCGASIKDGIKFCTNCGAALPVEAVIAEPVVDSGSQATSATDSLEQLQDVTQSNIYQEEGQSFQESADSPVPQQTFQQPPLEQGAAQQTFQQAPYGQDAAQQGFQQPGFGQAGEQQFQQPGQQYQQPYQNAQPLNTYSAPVTSTDSGSIGWGVLGFFFPIVGLILFLVWRNTKPNSAKVAGIGAIIGFVLNLILYFMM